MEDVSLWWCRYTPKTCLCRKIHTLILPCKEERCRYASLVQGAGNVTVRRPLFISGYSRVFSKWSLFGTTLREEIRVWEDKTMRIWCSNALRHTSKRFVRGGATSFWGDPLRCDSSVLWERLKARNLNVGEYLELASQVPLFWQLSLPFSSVATIDGFFLTQGLGSGRYVLLEGAWSFVE